MNATKILWGQVPLASTVVLAFVWGDGVGRLAPCLPAPARPSLVQNSRLAGLSATGFLLAVVRLRRLCAACRHRGRLYRGVRWNRRCHRGDRDVSLVRARGQARHHLWVEELSARTQALLLPGRAYSRCSGHEFRGDCDSDKQAFHLIRPTTPA